MKYRKHENPLCLAIYAKGHVCMACHKAKDGEYKGLYVCTGVDRIDNYIDECPFFFPACKHRINSDKGFALCRYKPSRDSWDCDPTTCQDYEEKEEE